MLATISDRTQLANMVRFIEQMGLNAQNEGMPRIAGRMAGYFVLFGGPVSFATLAEDLEVSRGSISTNARLLAGLGFIERVSVPGDRQDYYQLADQPFARLIEGSLQRLRNVEKIVDSALAEIDQNDQDMGSRMSEMKWFYQEAVQTTEDLLKKLSASSR